MPGPDVHWKHPHPCISPQNMTQKRPGESGGHTSQQEEFKAVIVGDEDCEKTLLNTVYTKVVFPRGERLTVDPNSAVVSGPGVFLCQWMNEC